MEKVTIEVSSLPPIEYSSNWRGHWRAQYAVGQIYREAVYYEAVNVRNKLNLAPFRKPRLTLTFVFAQERVRDEDNMRSRFKPGQDALVHARLLRGDSSKHLILGDITMIVDSSRAPLTIIELEEPDEDEITVRRGPGQRLSRKNNPLLQ